MHPLLDIVHSAIYPVRLLNRGVVRLSKPQGIPLYAIVSNLRSGSLRQTSMTAQRLPANLRDIYLKPYSLYTM